MSTFRLSLFLVIFTFFGVTPFGHMPTASAQTLPALFESGRPGARPSERPVRPFQARKARLRLDVLNEPEFRLNLFDNAERIARRTRVEQPAEGRAVWHGQTDDGGVVTFAIVNGVATGTAYVDGRSFEILPDPDGEHTIEELNSAAFPTEDGPLDTPDVVGDAGATSDAAVAADGATEIDVMVLWTPAARTAAGGQAAIESLILSAVSNANLAYTNSLVNARLRLVYSAEVAFTETPSNISSDLSALRSTTDGKIDGIHALRNQYGADVVSLIGNGYAGAGACGVGYLMSTPSTAYASNAFNVVDRTCAAGYLSFAHEVGHNQGLHHDPGNASSTPSYPYAYGYQDPGNLFRTVLSYGSATRIPYLSSPTVFYTGRVTGTATQDNARALNNNAAVVASFRATAGGSSCSYSVSPTSLSFQSSSGSASVTVTTTAGCSWTSSPGSSWTTVSGSGSGSGTATVAVSSNSGGSRSATVTIAGKAVTVSQAAAPAPTCTFTVSPASLSFASTGGSATVTVTASSSSCTWTSSSGSSWASVSGGGSGSGTASVVAASNSGSSRSATVTVAGQTVSVSQQAAPAPTCSFSVTPTSLSFTSAGGSATVTVTSSSNCAWTATSPVSWATVSGSGVGSGSATVAVVSTNGSARSATLTVAGQSVAVSQSGAAKGNKGGGKR